MFVDLDLRDAIGLERVDHSFASYVDFRTLSRSRGEILEVFLRGCDLPESFIEYQRSLAEAPIER